MVAILYITGMALLYAGMGWWMWKRPRPNINHVIGYRTRRAMKSQATWNFAQVYCGKMTLYSGLGMWVVAMPLYGLINNFIDYDQIVPFMAQLLVPTVAASILPMYLTERKLKQLFDENGNPIK